MLVCDMCLRRVLSFEINKFKIRKDVFSDMLTDEYTICSSCRRKLERFIRFEAARAKKAQTEDKKR